jgi:RNA polymerase sigma-70 factor, ECF subfamily
LEEARVIALVRAGEVDAFGEIVRDYQDTFVQAYKGILKTDAQLSFKAWLYRIATNNALQHHRRKRLLSFVPFTPKHEDIQVAPGRFTEESAIHGTLLQIPEEQRTCLVLHFVEGFKYREIAETLGCSEDGVRKRVARGKKAFIELYQGGGGGA